jgi:nucleoid-associated protein YgaU
VDRCQTAGASVPLPGWYVVKRGDTLWAIAERHYGAGRRYRAIFAANRERLKRGPDFILPCQQLYLPRQRRRGL